MAKVYEKKYTQFYKINLAPPEDIKNISSENIQNLVPSDFANATWETLCALTPKQLDHVGTVALSYIHPKYLANLLELYKDRQEPCQINKVMKKNGITKIVPIKSDGLALRLKQAIRINEKRQETLEIKNRLRYIDISHLKPDELVPLEIIEAKLSVSNKQMYHQIKELNFPVYYKNCKVNLNSTTYTLTQTKRNRPFFKKKDVIKYIESTRKGTNDYTPLTDIPILFTSNELAEKYSINLVDLRNWLVRFVDENQISVYQPFGVKRKYLEQDVIEVISIF